MAALLDFFARTCRTPARWGVNDCTLWPADWVKDATGHDPAAEYRGLYRTAEECRAILAEHGGILNAVAPGMARFAMTDEPIAGDVGVVRIGEKFAPVSGGLVGAIRGTSGWHVKGFRGVLMAEFERVAAWSLGICSLAFALLYSAPATADPIVTPLIAAALFNAEIFASVGSAIFAAQLITTVALVGASIGLQYALSPKPPGAGADSGMSKPEAGHVAIRQGINPRVTGFGRNRLAGVYTLYEEKDGISWDVIGFHSGKLAAIVGYFLHEDAVTIDGDGIVQQRADGSYDVILNADVGGGLAHVVTIKTRLGLGVETAYSEVVSALPTIWTEDHRGDGVASLMLSCKSTSVEKQLTTYPNGKPEPSVVAECINIWDIRDLAQDPDDQTTWIAYSAYSAVTTYAADDRVLFNGSVYYSRINANLNDQPDLNPESWCRVETNPVLQSIWYFINRMGLDRATFIDPVLVRLREEANICDELVDMASGDKESRYASSGFFSWDTDHATVLGSIMATCDGWYAEQFDGTLAMWVGKYRAPTVTLSDEHITGYSVSYGRPDEQATNELTLSFTSEAHKFKTVPGASLRNDEDIAEKGQTRSKALDLTWVRSQSQARRLQKRASAREWVDAGQIVTGTLSTKLYGIKADGQRWITIDYSQYPDLENVVVEVQPGGSYDLLNGKCGLSFLKINPNTIDAWDAVTEEGEQPPVPDELTGAPLPQPTIETAALIGDVVNGFSIKIQIDDPLRADLDYRLRYRLTDDGSGSPGPWNSTTLHDPPISAGLVTLTSDAVLSSRTYEVAVALVGGGGSIGEFSDSVSVSTSGAAPSAPTGLGSSRSGTTITVSWTNPNSGLFEHAKLYRAFVMTGNPAPAFGSAALVTTIFSAPSSSSSYDDTGRTSGNTYYYWVTAESLSNQASSPTGPTSQAVP